jgi:hypothetical protein
MSKKCLERDVPREVAGLGATHLHIAIARFISHNELPFSQLIPTSLFLSMYKGAMQSMVVVVVVGGLNLWL